MLQSQAQVTVNVINENDNVPTFSLASYTFEVAENLAAHALTSTNPAGLTMIQVSCCCSAYTAVGYTERYTIINFVLYYCHRLRMLILVYMEKSHTSY